MFNLPILQSGSILPWPRWSTGAWPSPWALSLAFLGGAAAVTWFCKTHLIGVLWGKTSPKWYEHVDKEVNHIRSNIIFHPELYTDDHWCGYDDVYNYIYVHDDDYFRMAGDDLFQKMFANALFYFFVLSLIKISFILVVDTHRGKKAFTRVILAAIHEELHWNYSSTLHKSISCHHQTLLGNYWMAVSGIRCLVKCVVTVRVSSTKIDVLGISPS